MILTHFCRFIFSLQYFEPPVSDHPKCRTEWSPTGGDRLQESNHKGASSEKRSSHIYFMEDIYCMQFSKLSHA